MKILIRGVNWIGDAVMTTPAIRGVRHLYPDAQIYLLVNPVVAQLFESDSSINEVIVYDRKGVHSGAFGFLKLVCMLRDYGFDMAILFQNAIEAAIIAFAAGIPVRTGYKTEMRGLLLTDAISRSPDILERPQVYYYMNILGESCCHDISPEPGLIVRDSELEHARGLLGRFKDRSMLIGINPGSTYGSAKRWAAERFAAVADELVLRYNAAIVIFGGPGEKWISGRVQELMEQEALNLGGKTSIRQLMALIKQCDLFITNDTGPMHIAAAFDIPLVAIFGSTDTKTTAPFGRRNRIIKKDMQCAPCLLRECPEDHHACMESISVEDVMSGIESFYPVCS